MMRILRELRWRFPTQRVAALVLINIYWLNFLVVQLPEEYTHLRCILFLHQFLSVFSDLTQQLIFLTMHLVLLLILMLWALNFRFKQPHLEAVVRPFVPITAYAIKAYPFIFQVVVLDLGLSCVMRHQQLLEIVFGGINILTAVGFSLGCNFINLTMQFNEIDYLALRKFEISTNLLQIAIVLCNTVLRRQQQLVVLVLNVCMALLVVFQQFQKYQYELVRTMCFFYNILLGLISVGRIVYYVTGVPQNSTKLLFLIALSVIVAEMLSHHLNLFIKYRLPSRLIKSNEYEQLIRQYQLARHQRTGKGGRLGYLFYNIIVQHHSKCVRADCRCRKRHLVSQLTGHHQEELFVLQNLRIMGQALSTISNISEIRLLEIYFFLEVAKEPIKAYYEIIRLKREKITFKTKTELESMIEMAKLCFAQIFKKNNVQNQELELMKLIEYEQNIERLEAIMVDAVGRSIQFLKLFTYHSVKISDVEDHTSQIQRVKREIEQLLDRLAQVNCESRSLNLFNFIFYRYVQFYRSRRLEFEKLKSQEQIKKRLFEKSEVNVFSSEHGTIYIDLIEQRGKILKITRNVCEMFGYPKSEMVDMNIDGYMPSIFARCHDRFLCNFIEKGEITLLKEKQRIVFGKNKKHFIFPFNIRLKVENMNEGAFGACALLTKLITNKEYILYGKKGCIDEMSEGIYERIFEPLLQADVGRTSRLNLMKLMPCLNLFVDLPDQHQTEMQEGLFIVPLEFNELMKFRYHRSLESEASPSDMTVDKFDRMSFNGTNQMSLDSRRGEKTDTRYLESFKSLITQVDILQLKGFKVAYKLSEVVTNYFEAKVMEIESVKEIPVDKKFFLNVIEEFRGLAAFFEINDEFSPWINKLNTLEKVINHFTIARILKVLNGPNLVSQYEQYISNDESDGEDVEQEQVVEQKQTSELEQPHDESEFMNEGDNWQSEQHNNVEAGGLVIHGNSEQSSVLGNEEHQNKKQLIIDAFSKDRSHGIPLSMVVFGVLAFVLILLVMAGMFATSYIVVFNERDQWRGGFFLMKVSQTLVYHTALTEISQFYALNSNQTSSKEFQQWVASESLRFADLYRSITQETLDVDLQRRSSYFQRNVTLFDPRVNTTASFNFFNLMHLLETLMMGNSSRYNLVEYNQLTIQQTLADLIDADLKYRDDRTKQLRLICLVLFVVMESLLILMAIVSIPIYNYFRERRMFLLRLLGYFNTRDIRKSMASMKFLEESLTISDESERADKILNQMQQKKTHSMSMRNTDLERQDQKGSKSLKLSFQGLRDTKNQFVCMILLTILMLSVYPTVMFGYNYSQQQAIERTSTFEDKLIAFENSVPVLLGTTFTNINRKQKGQDLLPLLVNLDKKRFFELIDFLAQENWMDESKKQLLTNLLTDDVCSSLQLGEECSSLYGGVLTKGYFYSMLLFRDKINYLLEHSQQLTPQDVESWIAENQIVDFLKLLSFLRRNVLLGSQLLQDNNLSFFDVYQQKLIYVAGVLALFSLCCTWLLKRWFVTRLMEIIKGAEKIYLNFNINILTENTYLTSYFNEKVRVKI